MPIYEATVTVTFSGRIEANSEHEAEQLAMESWADDHSSPLTYEGIEDATVEEVEMCDACGLEMYRGCDCDDEGDDE